MNTPRPCTTSSLISVLLSVANGSSATEEAAHVLREAADRIEALSEAVTVLHDLLHKSQAVFVPSSDGAHQLNYDALVKYEPLLEHAE